MRDVKVLCVVFREVVRVSYSDVVLSWVRRSFAQRAKSSCAEIVLSSRFCVTRRRRRDICFCAECEVWVGSLE